MKFSLYPPLVAFAALEAGIGMESVPVALIVGGGLVLATWGARFVYALRRAA